MKTSEKNTEALVLKHLNRDIGKSLFNKLVELFDMAGYMEMDIAEFCEALNQKFDSLDECSWGNPLSK